MGQSVSSNSDKQLAIGISVEVIDIDAFLSKQYAN